MPIPYFYPSIISSFVDTYNEPSLQITSYGYCKLNCYKCHNKIEFSRNIKGIITLDQMLKRIRLLLEDNTIYKFVVLSGGEFLFYDVDTIKLIIDVILDLDPRLKIIINTNGVYPDKIKAVEDYIDGFHIDIKYPYIFHINPQYNDLFKEIHGVEYNDDLVNNIMESISYIGNVSDLPYNMFRTVKYPIDNFDEYKTLIDEYVKSINRKNVQHQYNDFISI